MKQAHVAEYYTAYLEGSLPEPLRQEVDAHLRDCTQCAGELAELAQLVTCLHALPVVAVPADFSASVRARLPQRARRRFFWQAPALAGGLLAGAVTALLVIVRLGIGPAVSPGTMHGALPAPSTSATSTEIMREAKLPPSVEPSAPRALIGSVQGQKTATQKLPARPQQLSPTVTSVDDDPFAGGSITRVPSSASILREKKDAAPWIEGERETVATRKRRTDTPVTRGLTPGQEIAILPPTLRSDADGIVADKGAHTLHDKTNGSLSFGRAMKSAAPGVSGPVAGIPDTKSSIGNADLLFEKPAATVQGSTGPAGTPSAPVPTMAMAPLAADAVNEERAYGNAPKGITERTVAMNIQMPKSDDGPVLRLGKSTLRLQASQLPGAKEAQVVVHVTGTNAVPLVAYARTAAKPKEEDQSLLASSGAAAGVVSPDVRDLHLKLPSQPAGFAVTVALPTANGTETAYLIVPGTTARLQAVDVSLDRQPILPVLVRLVTATGAYLLCPAEFAERTATLRVNGMHPRQALTRLAEQAKYTLTVSPRVFVIAPQ